MIKKQRKKRESLIKNLSHYQKLWFFNFNRFKGNNYSLMREYFAEILIRELEEFMPLRNKKVLDVGGAKGEFCRILSELKGCNAINLDPSPGRNAWPRTKIGFAQNLPFKDNEFDLVICRGVIEHIPKEDQQKSVQEIYRVTKRGGFSYLMIPPWYNFHAGHSLKPFHILPFEWAKFLRQLVFREKIKAGSFEELALFPITFKRMSQLILSNGFEILATKDTHFRLHFLTKFPVIREIAVPSIAFIVRKPKDKTF